MAPFKVPLVWLGGYETTPGVHCYQLKEDHPTHVSQVDTYCIERDTGMIYRESSEASTGKDYLDSNRSSQPAERTPASADLAKCNDQGALDVVRDGTYGVARKRLEDLAGANAGLPTRAEVASMVATIEDVRQTAFDPINNSRLCAANFNYGSGYIPHAVLRAVEVPSYCRRGVQYKIESLLDKPGYSYVSWKCDD